MSIDHYYTLGRTGLRVSRLSLGTMTFGREWGWGCDEATARAIFDTYLEAGGNFVDTADLYTQGTSETYLGKFVAERKARDRVVIATKFTHNPEAGNPNSGGNGRKNILRAVEGSLRRLQTDYIDLYILHTWDLLTPPEEVIRTFDDLVRAGKIRHAGLSDVPAWYAATMQTIAELRGYEPIASVQLEYSLVERNIEREFVALGQAKGMGITAWSPLASGVLSGKYKRGETDLKGQGRLGVMQALAPKSSDPSKRDASNFALARLTDRAFAVLDEVEAVARELGRSVPQVALNWVANRPAVASVIIGATTTAQCAENLKALDFEIPLELRTRLDAVGAPKLQHPYGFFTGEVQRRMRGGKSVAAKPPGYSRDEVLESANPGPKG